MTLVGPKRHSIKKITNFSDFDLCTFAIRSYFSDSFSNFTNVSVIACAILVVIKISSA